MRHALASMIMLLSANLAVAASEGGVYRAGDNRVLSLSDVTETSFQFSLAIGAPEGETSCAEGDVSCLAIAGAAEASAERFVYVDPSGEGSITFEIKDGDVVISKVQGLLGSGSANAQQLNWIAGVYELPAQNNYVFFKTPSGNIGCAISTADEGALRCDMKELSQTYKDRPAECEFEWGSAFQMTKTGKGQVICFNDTVLNADAPKLDYGKTLSEGGFECLSEKTGLTCKNVSGHGFILSKAQQKVF